MLAGLQPPRVEAHARVEAQVQQLAATEREDQAIEAAELAGSELLFTGDICAWCGKGQTSDQLTWRSLRLSG